jgi:hypothetical protein
LLRSGTIGDLVRLEVGCSGDIYDTGTHYIECAASTQASPRQSG